jgi:hypothetical protein
MLGMMQSDLVDALLETVLPFNLVHLNHVTRWN